MRKSISLVGAALVVAWVVGGAALAWGSWRHPCRLGATELASVRGGAGCYREHLVPCAGDLPPNQKCGDVECVNTDGKWLCPLLPPGQKRFGYYPARPIPFYLVCGDGYTTGSDGVGPTYNVQCVIKVQCGTDCTETYDPHTGGSKWVCTVLNGAPRTPWGPIHQDILCNNTTCQLAGPR